jgi:outer membrane protein OmpA-like peptidoglycan-associated protein
MKTALRSAAGMLAACALIAVAGVRAGGQSYQIQQPSGHWQTPGPIQVPKGPWQKPGAIQVPKGIQAIKTRKADCTQWLTVGSDALFEFNRSTLSPDATKTLSALGPLITKAGKHPVRIDGYTDSIGSVEYNLDLSERRARTVRDWLAAHRYVPVATPIQGFGKSNPVAPNTKPDGSDNPQGRAKNRRVEIEIDTCH